MYVYWIEISLLSLVLDKHTIKHFKRMMIVYTWYPSRHNPKWDLSQLFTGQWICELLHFLSHQPHSLFSTQLVVTTTILNWTEKLLFFLEQLHDSIFDLTLLLDAEMKFVIVFFFFFRKISKNNSNISAHVCLSVCHSQTDAYWFSFLFLLWIICLP